MYNPVSPEPEPDAQEDPASQTSRHTVYPFTLAQTLPAEMLEAPRWIVFQLAWTTDKKGVRKLKKTPYNARTGKLAKSNDARSWATFGEACAAYQSGRFGDLATLGFALGDGFVGVDLDKCRNPETGALIEDARAIIADLDSYTEVSPSGTGVHILTYGALPDGERTKKGIGQTGEKFDIEMYDAGRFFTVTGEPLADAPRALNARTDALAALHTRTFARPDARSDARSSSDAPATPAEPLAAEPKTSAAAPPIGSAQDADMSDSAVLTRACGAVNGPAFERLYRGDTSDYGDDASRADWALICALRFYTRGDAAQMERLFTQSGLMRDKWGERHYASGATYGAETITKALTGPYEVWTPRPRRQRSADRGASSAASSAASSSGSASGSGSAASGGEGGDAPTPQGERRRICLNEGEPGDVCRAVIAELYAHHQSTRIFQRSGHLVYLHDEGDGLLSIQELGEDRLRALVEDTMRCYTVHAVGRGDAAEPQDKDVLLSKDFARMILAASAWPFPPISGVTSVPIVRPDGTIYDTPGYDALTRRYYAPRARLALPHIAAAPAQVEAEAAARRLARLFTDFPFAHRETDTANALAFMLTPLLRAAIRGPVPMAAVDATKAGSGKSKLMKVLVAAATGAPCEEVRFQAWPNGDESEARKRLTSLLASGTDIIAFDNIKGVLNSAALEAMLTADAGEDRLLGASHIVKFANRASWIATGNGMRLGGDMYRRAYMIRLDAGSSHPELRQEDDFTLPDIEGYVDAHLGALLADLLTMIRAWYAAGAPRSARQPVLGSFEKWVHIIAGVLDYAGVAGFLATQQDDMRLADEESDEWSAFLLAWHKQYGNAPVLVNEAARYMEGDGLSLMTEALPAYLAREYGKPGKGFRVALGSALRSRIGRRYGEQEVRILLAGRDAHAEANLWRVEVNEPTPEAQPEATSDAPTAQYAPDSLTYTGDAADERPQVLWGDDGADAAPYAPSPDESPDEWGDDDDDGDGATVPAGRYAIEEDGAMRPIMAPASSGANGKPNGKGAQS